MNTKRFLLAEVKAIGDEDGPGEFEAILSTDSVDRDGEVLDARCFEPLPEHITIDVDHGLSTMTTVASATPFYDEAGTLRCKGTFSSIARAQDVRTLVKEGHIRTMSVAYIKRKRKLVEGVPHVTKGELLNAAFVAVPAQPGALITSAKSGARNSAADQAHLDSAHDALVAVGAQCNAVVDDEEDTDEKAAKSVRFKTIAGSYEHRQEVLGEALEEAYEDAWWVRLLATTDADITYQVYGGASAGQQYRCTYEIADDGAVSLGEPEAGQLVEVFTPAPVEDDELEAQTEEDADAKGAADQLELRARAVRIRALLHDTVA